MHINIKSLLTIEYFERCGYREFRYVDGDKSVFKINTSYNKL